MKLVRWFERYAAHGDPRIALANLIALLIVSNQPFYPLYVYGIAGNAAWITVVTFLSTPFFFAVPAAARCNAAAGRILLCITGTANTVLCMKVLGEQTGVGLFLLPCILLGVLLFRPAQRLAIAFCAGLPMMAFLLLHGRLGPPLHPFSAQQYTSLVTLHAVSVGALIAVIAFAFTTRIEAARP